MAGASGGAAGAGGGGTAGAASLPQTCVAFADMNQPIRS